LRNAALVDIEVSLGASLPQH